MILAAIDIGSNAARLLINEVTPNKDNTVNFTKVNLLRVPLRLGFDVFNTGKLGPERMQALSDTMNAFKYLMKAHGAEKVKIVATSALRDAQNKEEILEKVLNESGLSINIITGQQEAQLLFESHEAEKISNSNHHLYIDVGGGSTELTLYYDNQVLFRESYNIGTIRFLTKTIDDAEWQKMKQACKQLGRQYSKIDAIGSGGNINKAVELCKLPSGKPASYEALKQWHQKLEALDVPQRMKQFKFKADRADVIVPALLIYTSVMKWTGCYNIYVPQIGVTDALIKMLYNEHFS